MYCLSVLSERLTNENLSVPLIVPGHLVVGHLLLNERLGDRMVGLSEPLRIPVDYKLLISFTDLDSTTSRAISLPLGNKFLISVEFIVTEFGEDVRMVRAVEIASNHSDILAIWIVPNRTQLDLNVLKYAIFVEVNALNQLLKSLHLSAFGGLYYYYLFT